jgi:periplasmic copper chaperone A
MRATRTLLIIALIAGAPTPFAPSSMLRLAAAQGMPGMFKAGDIVVETPWLRATPRGAGVAGGYMKITNNGRESDRLVAATLEGAPRVELHEMSMHGDVMQMRPLAKGVAIKPGATVELKPGGYHVMGMDLTRGFKEGEVVKGTLTFEKAGKVEIEYRVGPVGGASPGHSPGSMKH